MASPDIREVKAALVLQLTDGFAKTNRLAGSVAARIGLRAAAFQNQQDGMFVFLELAAGAYNVDVASPPDAPYYVSKSIPVTVPSTDSRWPAYPDRGLADLSKALDDPSQPPAYRAQRDFVRLMPSVAYPFPGGATLVRGTITAGTVPLAGASVRRSADADAYLTDRDGEYVLFFDQITGRRETITIVASHPARPDVTATTDVLRGSTTTLDFVMAP